MKFLEKFIFNLAVVAFLQALGTVDAFAENSTERFKDFEIRVIRPKYFSKRKRFELGVDAAVLSNQTFIYTYFLSLNGTFHLTETLSLEGTGAYGLSIDKADKTALAEAPSNIKAQIIRTSYFVDGSMLWTPIYGKYQLESGRLIYFDTFLIGGYGMSGAEYKFDHCISPSDVIGSGAAGTAEPPSPTTKTYPTLVAGLGQRYFINKNTSLKWSLRYHNFSYPLADGSCDPINPDVGTNSHQNVFIQLGASKFF